MYARTNSRPVQYMDFLKSKKVRQRYWARNFVAWPRFSSFEPNAIHHSLARFEREGRLMGLVTQNVDRLHQKSGSKNVTELHGSGYEVACLTDNCDYRIDRHDFQDILNALNANMVDKSDMVRPDGDVEIPQVKETGISLQYAKYRLPLLDRITSTISMYPFVRNATVDC